MSLRQLFFRTKPLEHTEHPHRLRRCLSAFDLTMLGIGAIIGAGIFVLTGIAAATKAGPAVMLSYVLAACACGFSALCYAELASSVGGCGSAYNYAYVGIGELFAWVVGWTLLLEYSLAVSAVAIGWSSYLFDTLRAVGIVIPQSLRAGPLDHGIINLPAASIVLTIMTLLAIGVKESARFNAVIVFIKLAVLGLFIFIAARHFNIDNWHPFLPFGWAGIANGAALIFFAYIGFDAVSTAAEETHHPERDLPIGIIASLVICSLIYVVVSGLLTGIVPYTDLDVSSPVAHALIEIGYRSMGAIVAVGAIAGLTTVILVMYYGLTRIFFAMSRDRMLPTYFAWIHPTRHTPVRIILTTGILMALIAGLIPIHRVAELVNIGTLAAFSVVSIGVIILRYTKPNMPRPFRVPWAPFIPAVGVILCVYLMLSLSELTWINFAVWSTIGLIIYFSYSRYRSLV